MGRPLTAAGASPGSNDAEISRSCNNARTTQTHHWPEGIPVEPASGENPGIEKKRVAAAVAQPFLTSGDSIGFGILPCRDAKPFGPSVHAPTNESSQSFPIFSYLSEDFRNWLRSAASCENGSFVYQHGSAAHWESAD